MLTRYGATDILRSFPDANPADTLMFNEFGQPIRLINRSLVYRFRFPERTDLGRAAEDLSEIHEIVFASEIPEYQLDIIVQDPFFSFIRRPPNDTHYAGRQWNLHHTGQGSQPPITTDGGRADMRARDAWNLFTGSNSTRIGIIDTGTSLTHEDLSGKVIGDPHTGNHGTHVGGIAAAITDNQLGISGVDWHAELISGNFSSWMPEDAYDTILASVSLGAQILNNSWSFLPGHQLDDPIRLLN